MSLQPSGRLDTTGKDLQLVYDFSAQFMGISNKWLSGSNIALFFFCFFFANFPYDGEDKASERMFCKAVVTFFPIRHHT